MSPPSGCAASLFPGAPGRRQRLSLAVVAAMIAVTALGGCGSASGGTGGARASGSPSIWVPPTTAATAPSVTPTPVPSPTAPTADAPDFPPFPDIGASEPAAYEPSLAVALDDEPQPYLDGCHQLRAESRVEACVFGDGGSSTRVVLLGDSHAAQWHGGVAEVAEAEGWRLETLTKSACPISTTQVWIRKDDSPYATCSAWNEAVMAQLLVDPPDVVVTSMSGEYDAVVDGELVRAGPEADALVAAGVAESWRMLLDVGVRVVVLADTGWYPVEVVPCLLETPEDPARCDAPREQALDRSGVHILRLAVEQEPRVRMVDLTEALCGPEVCPAVLDGRVVMRDEHHLTATFSRSLAPWIGAGLDWALAPSS